MRKVPNRTTLKFIFLGLLLNLASVCSPLPAGENVALVKGSLLYYFDNRDFNTMSVVLSSNRLPWGVSFWGFTDLHGSMNNEQRGDSTSTFSEYRLSKPIKGLEGLGFQVEFNDTTPGGGNIVRLGMTYKHALVGNGSLQWRLFPYETDHNGGQASLIFNQPLAKRLSLTGFADYNWRESAKNQWVIEPQLNFQISARWFVMLEYRQNGYQRDAPLLDGTGYALGLRLNL